MNTHVRMLEHEQEQLEELEHSMECEAPPSKVRVGPPGKFCSCAFHQDGGPLTCLWHCAQFHPLLREQPESSIALDDELIKANLRSTNAGILYKASHQSVLR